MELVEDKRCVGTGKTFDLLDVVTMALTVGDDESTETICKCACWSEIVQVFTKIAIPVRFSSSHAHNHLHTLQWCTPSMSKAHSRTVCPAFIISLVAMLGTELCLCALRVIVQLAFYDSRASTWDAQFKGMCPETPPLVLMAKISETTDVQCAINTVTLKIDVASPIPVGTSIVVEGLDAQL
jgi:hypothetical protein